MERNNLIDFKVKFRIWDIINKAWCTDFTISLDGELLCDNGGALFIRDNFVLMQSSRLVDKNNKQIYVGDIVHYERGDFSSRIFVEDLFCPFFCHVYIDEDRMNPFHSKYYEVVGNIYENLELIDVKQK